MSIPLQIPSAALEAIFRRAAVDADYHAWLLRDANAAVADVAPAALPAGARVAFTTRPASVDALFVLPDLTVRRELSSAELENVAGGLVNDPTCGAVTCGITCTFTCADATTQV